MLLAFWLTGAAGERPGAREREAPFRNPQPTTIRGLPIGSGGTPISTEEPFVSRDGRFLFFNSGKEEGNKDLHFAERGDLGWSYRGEVGPGINDAKEVQGNPTMDAEGEFYFVDSSTESMIQAGRFQPDTGELEAAREVAGFPTKRIRLFAQRIHGNMGVELSADGDLAFFSRATWDLNGIAIGMIEASDLLFARKSGEHFVYDEAEVARIMANVNTTEDLEYAASISEDGLELFFTRLPRKTIQARQPRSMILRAIRRTITEPFESPTMIESIGNDHFVEGPAITPDGRTLYYHRRAGNKFRLFRVTR